MDRETLRSKLASRFLWYNLLAMLLVLILLMLGVKWGLAVYTHHGEGIPVPNLERMSYSKARLLLEQDGLQIVVSDSGYVKTLPADCVLAQTPGHGTRVKAGHTVYVTLNSPSSPTVAIPDIVDNSSYREAEAKLAAIGFRLLPPQTVVGEKDWVYGVSCRGRRVANGDRIPTEYPLTLIIGSGTYEETDDYDYTDGAEGSSEGGASADFDDFEEVHEAPSEDGIN